MIEQEKCDLLIQVLYTDILEDCWIGWKGFRKSCYKIFTNSSFNKEQAEYHCIRYGGHLVSISSKEEMELSVPARIPFPL
jgi:hypothetical protein